ncbi:MAG: hypothetical protein M3R61_03235 [Chloroflexota bacterium]|nr:hypothetical protein [Chloroflexota bacterium]
MSIVLACAWKPRGELARFQALQPRLADLYTRIIVSVPPDCPSTLVDDLLTMPNITVIQPTDWAAGRHAAIFAAADGGAPYVHYTDFERLIRWLETAPHEIPAVLHALQQTDCLIIGRSPAALATHAHALQHTEHITNRIFSHLLGQAVDLGGGSRGFSHRAVAFLQRHSPPERAIGTDAAWPILLHRAGFGLRTFMVNGLTWEVPDHYKRHAVGMDEQRTFADQYDQDASRWELRVQTASEILEAGLDALNQPLPEELFLNPRSEASS